MIRNKILAVAGLASMAFAGSGGDLWNFPKLLDPESEPYWTQVRTPAVIFCWGDAEPPSSENSYYSPCYSQAGGWWFGYADEGGEVKDAVSNKKVFKPASADPCVQPSVPAEAEGSIILEKYIDASNNGDWKSISEPTFKNGGHYLIKEFGLGDAKNGLDVKFITPAATPETPSIAAIGFNWRGKKECDTDDYKSTYVEDISNKEGLCIVYKADKAGVEIELGWNEAKYEYNTWVAKLPAASDWKTIEAIFEEDFAPSYEGEDDPYPLETALTQAEALKLALKNKTDDDVTIHFQLKEIGWKGSCTGTASRPDKPTPITVGKIASAYKFIVNGRTLSANFAAGSVQVINLQGAVVAKKTLDATGTMSLANLPAGIYMVRSEKLGIVQKFMVK